MANRILLFDYFVLLILFLTLSFSIIFIHAARSTTSITQILSESEVAHGLASNQNRPFVVPRRKKRLHNNTDKKLTRHERASNLGHVLSLDPTTIRLKFLRSANHKADELHTLNPGLPLLPLEAKRSAAGQRKRPSVDVWRQSKYISEEVAPSISLNVRPGKATSAARNTTETQEQSDLLEHQNQIASIQNHDNEAPPPYKSGFIRGAVERLQSTGKQYYDAKRREDADKSDFLTEYAWQRAASRIAEHHADIRWEREVESAPGDIIDSREYFQAEYQRNGNRHYFKKIPLNQAGIDMYHLGKPMPIPGDNEPIEEVSKYPANGENEERNFEKLGPKVKVDSEGFPEIKSLDEQTEDAATQEKSEPETLRFVKRERDNMQASTQDGGFRVVPERKFRQYLLNVAMNNEDTRITLWSLIVKMSVEKPPVIDWRSMSKVKDVNFAPRDAILEILSKLHFHDMRSVCSYLLYYDLDVPTILKELPLRGPSEVEYPVEAVAESYVPIFPEVAVMFRSTAGLRDVSLRDRSWVFLALRRFINSRPISSPIIPFTTPDWTRPITGQEEGIYTFLATNFLRNTLDALSIAKESQQRIARSMTYSPELLSASCRTIVISPEKFVVAGNNVTDFCEGCARESKRRRKDKKKISKKALASTSKKKIGRVSHRSPHEMSGLISASQKRTLPFREQDGFKYRDVQKLLKSRRWAEALSSFQKSVRRREARLEERMELDRKKNNIRKGENPAPVVRQILEKPQVESKGVTGSLEKNTTTRDGAGLLHEKSHNGASDKKNIEQVNGKPRNSQPINIKPTKRGSSQNKRRRSADLSYYQEVCERDEFMDPVDRMLQFIDINGIVDVGSASLQIVFPVERIPPDSPIGGINLSGKYLPSNLFPQLQVFATSYMNLGANRALGLLMKQHCEMTSALTEGICQFPCFPKGWKSPCIPGNPVLRQNTKNETEIVIEGNFLEPTGTYCDKSNFVAFQSAAIEFDCQATGFPLSKPYEERIKIHHCNEVHGTGNFEQCAELIHKLLLEKQLPANQEASSFGAATPSEIGKFLHPTRLMYMVGRAVIEPVLVFKSLGLMPTESDEPSADFHYLRNATARFCATPLNNNVTGATVPFTVDLESHDFCFRASYINSILESLKVSLNGPRIYFKPDLRNGIGEPIGEFGWEIGSLLHTVLKPSFVTDMYYLRSSHWRPLLFDDTCSKDHDELPPYPPII